MVAQHSMDSVVACVGVITVWYGRYARVCEQ